MEQDDPVGVAGGLGGFGAAFLAATWRSAAAGRCPASSRVACLLLYTGVRVENFFLVPPMLAVLLIWHHRHWLAIGAAGAATVAMFVAFSIVIDKQNHNWQIRMTNLVLTRILPDESLRAEFLAQGLPAEPALLAASGRMLAAYDPAFVKTPQFQRWLDEQSRPAYVAWLGTLEPHRILVDKIDNAMKHWPYAFNYYFAGSPAGECLDFYPWSHEMRMPFAQWRWLALIPIACALLTLDLAFVDLFALAYFAAVYSMAFAATATPAVGSPYGPHRRAVSVRADRGAGAGVERLRPLWRRRHDRCRPLHDRVRSMIMKPLQVYRTRPRWRGSSPGREPAAGRSRRRSAPPCARRRVPSRRIPCSPSAA